MPDTTAEPITPHAFIPAELRIVGNARTDTGATITKEWIAQLKAHAAADPTGCGNHTPVPVVRRPGGELEILYGARRTLGCIRAGVYLFGYPVGAKGDGQAARLARLIDQFTENHHREPMRHSDEAALILTLSGEEGMTDTGIAKATGLGKPTIAAYRAAARSDTAAKAADRWEFLTLDQAAILSPDDLSPV